MEAERLFRDGNKMITTGLVAQACEAFEASNRVEPRAGTLIRLGVCREQNQQLASAWSAYKDALSRAKDSRKRVFAAAKVKELESRLSYLLISVTDDSLIEGLGIARNGVPLEPTLWNKKLPADGGQYVIIGNATGHKEWQTTVQVPIEKAEVNVEVPKLEELSNSLSPSALVPAADRAGRGGAKLRDIVSTPTAPGSHTKWSTNRKIAVGAAAVSILALSAGTVLGISARSKQIDAYAMCPNPSISCDSASRANELLRSGHTLAISADVAWGVGASAAIATGVLWFIDVRRSYYHASLIPCLSPRQVVVMARGAF